MSTLSLTKSQEEERTSTSLLGFWIYLMTDCVLFATLFAAYAVLRNQTFDGSSAKDLFSMPYVLVETMLLLTSSFTCGLALLSAKNKNKNQTIIWLAITFILGGLFLGMELIEFRNLYLENESWRRSGFLSAYFTLVGTHGLHITAGLIWLLVLVFRLFKSSINYSYLRRLTMFGMFWHFLDIVWIFIFTFVYLGGVVKL